MIASVTHFSQLRKIDFPPKVEFYCLLLRQQIAFIHLAIFLTTGRINARTLSQVFKEWCACGIEK